MSFIYAGLLELSFPQFSIGPLSPVFFFFFLFFFLPFSNKPTVHCRSTSSWRQQCTLSQCDRREPKHERRLRWSKTTSGAVPRWHVAEKSSELPGQLQWPFLLILIVLESSRDSEQVDTKFTKFRSQKNWHVSMWNQNFVTRFEPNRALFWCNDTGFLLVVKNASKWYILPMFSNMSKIMLFKAELLITVV